MCPVVMDVLLEELGTLAVSAASLADILVLVSDEGIMPVIGDVVCSARYLQQLGASAVTLQHFKLLVAE